MLPTTNRNGRLTLPDVMPSEPVIEAHHARARWLLAWLLLRAAWGGALLWLLWTLTKSIDHLAAVVALK